MSGRLVRCLSCEVLNELTSRGRDRWMQDYSQETASGMRIVVAMSFYARELRRPSASKNRRAHFVMKAI